MSEFTRNFMLYSSDRPSLRDSLLKLQRIAEDNGAPAVYAISYSYVYVPGRIYSGFGEIETTHAEEGNNKIISIIREGNEKQKEIRRALVQLAFDSNKISADDYSKQMGVECRFEDCRDYACKRYKAECCRTYHKNSIFC